MRTNRRLETLAMLATLTLAACGGGGGQDAARASDTAQAGASGAAPAGMAGNSATPDAGGKVIVVEMLTDEQGNNIFRPASVDAKRGDVLRYTLVSGVHNVHFLADSNPGKSGLPAASDMLQLPGQTQDIKVGWEPGRYYFQCDPHALLGMKGHVTVAP